MGDLIIIIIIRNGAKTISLQTLFGRLNKQRTTQRTKSEYYVGSHKWISKYKLLCVTWYYSQVQEHLSSPMVFSGGCFARSLVFCVMFIDRCLPYCPFFSHCIVSPSIYSIWLPVLYPKTFLLLFPFVFLLLLTAHLEPKNHGASGQCV